MINEIVLVGKINEIGEVEKNKQMIKLEVKRFLNEINDINSDIFTCRLWSSIFSKIVKLCDIGDTLAIRGRLENNEGQMQVVAEKVVLLNKSKKNILKGREI